MGRRGPRPNAERNREITHLVVSIGMTLQAVADQYGITRQRVEQIVRRETGGSVRTLRPWTAGDAPPVDHHARQVRRFWARFRVDENGCWIWTGAMYPTGYGHVQYQGELYSHRVAYKFVKGPIPDGLTIDHLCRVRACGNPEHLEAVTPHVNILRGVGMGARNARKTQCKNGHEFTPENTRATTARNGSTRRACRTCGRLRTTRKRVEKAAA